MPEVLLLSTGLAFLVPLGYALIACGGLPEARAHRAVLGLMAALGLSTLGYFASGFALQFGGVGLAHPLPGLDGLVWEWSALGSTWGSGWGMAGLVGWGMAGPATTSAAIMLAVANLPWVTTAAMIPLIGLRGRIPAWAAGLLELVVGAALYPLAGNWVWGGGWLANLGSNLGFGHGLVDVGGSGMVHLLGGAVTLAGLLVFTDRAPRPASRTPAPLPPVHLPLLAALGAGLLLSGSFAWTIANPLLSSSTLNMPRMALNIFLAASAGALLPLAYTWFVAGSADPLMAIRGFAAGTIAITAAAPFVPPWAALAIGGGVGALVLMAIFVVNHVLRWEDPTAALSVHGLAGALGLLATGIFADGLYGQDWGSSQSVAQGGVTVQGIAGLIPAAGLLPDWPGQFQAQAVGVLAISLFAFLAAWVLVAPPTLIGRLARRQRARQQATGSADLAEALLTSPDSGSTERLAEDLLAGGSAADATTGTPGPSASEA